MKKPASKSNKQATEHLTNGWTTSIRSLTPQMPASKPAASQSIGQSGS